MLEITNGSIQANGKSSGVGAVINAPHSAQVELSNRYIENS